MRSVDRLKIELVRQVAPDHRPGEGRDGEVGSTLHKLDAEMTAQLKRIAQVAVATGARFVRERVEESAMDWMLTPKQMFNGRTPIDACREPEAFRRAMLLHEFCLGMDAQPLLFDELPRSSLFPVDAVWPKQGHSQGVANSPDQCRTELFTYVIVADAGDGQVQIFGAMMARSPGEVRKRLRARFGTRLEDEGVVRSGFDWSEPLACALVSDAVGELLLLAAQAPSSSLAQGLDFQVEQRFAV